MRFDRTSRSGRFRFSGPAAGDLRNDSVQLSPQDVHFDNPVPTGTRLRLGERLFLVTQTERDGRSGTIKPLLIKTGISI